MNLYVAGYWSILWKPMESSKTTVRITALGRDDSSKEVNVTTLGLGYLRYMVSILIYPPLAF